MDIITSAPRDLAFPPVYDRAEFDPRHNPISAVIRQMEVGAITHWRVATASDYATVRGISYDLGRTLGRRFRARRLSPGLIEIRRMRDVIP